ncbi:MULTISPECIES: N-6 DNA methylase [Marinobacter]|uniref:N-6 DNA methylase n=1 Tax=Marinobacter TaxID=2742 RepID=UPI0009490489|nr:N-6 DNA methylase [Marinobacter sp. C18]OLF84410.1 hypothetical protein AWH63_17735 [Marinobacter sp. C18]HIO03677.1 hypothetical protein [Alphaproteobacteria bacterium]
MHSIERSILMDIADVLRQEGIALNRVADELALLTAWAAYSHQKYGGVHWHEQQPDIRYAFESMSKHLGENGQVYKNSHLPDMLSGAAINTIKDHLNLLSGTSSHGLAQALVAVVEKIEYPGQMITPDLGRLLAGFCAAGQGKIALHHEASFPVLVVLDAPQKAALTMRTISAYPVALSYLLEANLKFSDSVWSENPSEPTEFVISAPPLQATGFSKTSKLKSDELAVLRVARECSERGVVYSSPGVLFSRAAMSVREEIINKNWLDAVIGLPKGTLLNTAVAPVLLVIDKNRGKGDPIAFVETEVPQTEDSLEQLVRAVRDKNPFEQGAVASQLDIQKNDYDLTISRYKLGLATQKLARLDNTVSLDGVAEIVRAQSLKDAEENEDAKVFLEASVRDITESGRMNAPAKAMRVDKKQLRRAQNQRLYPGDILLAIKGSVGRVAFVDDSCGDNWIAGQAFIIIRPKGTAVSTPFLYQYLASELIQEYIQETATGAVMALLKAADVSGIPVPLPSPEIRDAVETTHKQILAEYEAIKEHRDTISRLKLQNWSLQSANGATNV